MLRRLGEKTILSQFTYILGRVFLAVSIVFRFLDRIITDLGSRDASMNFY